MCIIMRFQCALEHSVKTSHDHAAYVATLIGDHHSTFCQLYSGRSIIPKMHFMVHMPKLMIK